MAYDFANMVPHTCRNYGGNSSIAQATDDFACLNVVDEMKEFIDKIVEETDNGATKFWEKVYKKFYLESNRGARGLSKRQVISRAGNIKTAQNGKNIYSMLESPKMSKVKNDIVSFPPSLTAPGMMTPKRSRGNKVSSACSVGHIRSYAACFDTTVSIFLLTGPSGAHRKDFISSLLL
ncbi:hypothetical protein PI124_g23821 [Phytophthora idaei]|nr:hypothetical protein PI124_g23821 [Phytophthora idaei]